jgi:hypothetical protein
METNLLAYAARSRADRTRLVPPPTHESISDFAQRLPPGGYGSAAHARHGPQRTQTASNSTKEGLQKGHAHVCTADRA